MTKEEKDHVICMLKMFYTDTVDLLENVQTKWDRNAYNDTLEKLDGALDIMEHVGKGTKIIKVYVEGGVVQSVEDVPEGYMVDIIDKDNEE